MSAFWQDIRFGLRMLAKTPGFTSIAVLTLALGIGANTTIFSAVNAFLLRPLPFDGGERLVWLQERDGTFGNVPVAYANYLDWCDRNETFEDIACYRNSSPNVTGAEIPERINVRQVTANLFSMLGVQPFLGRAFDKNDDPQDTEKTVILSYAYWQRRFGCEESAIGKTILFDGEPHTIIGVMPRGFCFPPFLSSQCDAWTPIELMESQDWFLRRSNHAGNSAVGKLKERISIERAQADIDTIASQLREAYPDANSDYSVTLANYRERIVRRVKPAILTLMGAVFFVLLMMSTNIGNLLLGRSSARVQEFAVRNALGAGRMRIARQVLCEGMILIALGGVGGLLVVMWGLDFISRIFPDNTSVDLREFFRIDETVLFFSLVLSLGSGLLFSLAPALQASRANLNDVMKDSGRSTTGGSKHKRFREILIVAEISLALVLLVGAGLMTRSLYRYLQADPGYDPHSVLLMDLSLNEKKYPEENQKAMFYRQLLRRMDGIPGVRHASVASNVLGGWGSIYYAEGAPVPKPGQASVAEYNCVSPDHFKAMSVRLIEGRFFTDQDVQDSKPVVIVDERFAQKWWPDESAVGKRLKADSSGPDGGEPWREVVGVVGHIKHYGVDQFSRESLYIPMDQWPEHDVTLVIRTQVDPLQLVSSIRSEIRAMDDELPAFNIRTLIKVAEERSFVRRFTTTLLGIFALTALFLAMFGIYGVMAYSVSQRSHEIGVRMALGAQVSDVLRLVLKGGLRLIGIGVSIGLAGAFALTRVISSMLYGLSATDPVTFAGVSLLLAGVALAASYVPARRAARIDPMAALRYE